MQSIGSKHKSDSVMEKKTNDQKILDLIPEKSFECKQKYKL